MPSRSGRAPTTEIGVASAPPLLRLTRAAFALLLAMSLAAFAAAAADTASPGRTLAGKQLLSALRQGGYVLYFRHTATDFSQNDEQMTGYEDCARQRNLTDAGRADARAIGAAMRSLGIPIGDVLASPFCRTRETAELIFGRATNSTAVRGGPATAEGGRYDELKALLARKFSGNVNLAIASHGNPFVAVAGGPYLAEGEAAVIEPLGAGGFRVVARIRKDEWAALK
jgi:phosphohistidine phosphatase SixA